MPIALGLRPRLRLNVPGTADAIAARVQAASGDYGVTALGTYLVISIPPEQRHYWSPQLQITLEDHDGGVHVSGLITPMPAVWTLFAGLYALVVTLGFFGTIVGLAQLTIDRHPNFLWCAPITAILLAVIYAAARLGQKLGHEQTEELTAFLHRCTEQEGGDAPA